MPCATELVNGEGGPIKVGSTGTVGSLMLRELDAAKVVPEGTSTPRLRRQTSPVSVPCGASPRKMMQRKISSSDSTTTTTSSSSNSSSTDRANAEDAGKPRRVLHRNAYHSPILHSDSVLADRSPSTEKANKKKGGHGHAVAVVDIKCGNPMSSRLRKLGFSKLSETFA